MGNLLERGSSVDQFSLISWKLKRRNWLTTIPSFRSTIGKRIVEHLSRGGGFGFIYGVDNVN